MARYIYLIEHGETIYDRYRVLEPGERLGDVDELGELTGVISEAVAEAFSIALEEKYRSDGMTVCETRGQSWSEAKENL